MPKATREQLEKIKTFSRAEDLTEDSVYVFSDRMIDTGVTCYHSTLHENLLRKFEADAKKGTPLMLAHDKNHLPVGRVFDARLQLDTLDNGETRMTLYGDHFIDYGRNTTYGVSTDDIIKGIDMGVINDSSIGLSATQWTCNICGNDIRDFRKCDHFLGEKYVVDNNGQDEVKTCLVIVGEDGNGELLENSLVYAGACDRAEILGAGNLSNNPQNHSETSKLYKVDNIKDVPVGATMLQYFSKDEFVCFTTSPDRTGGSVEALKRSEERMEFEALKNILGEFGIECKDEAELKASLSALKAEPQVDNTELDATKAELETVKAELSTKGTELDAVKADLEAKGTELTAKDEEITNLKAEVEDLKKDSATAQEFRTDLEKQVVEAGVRAYGNAFSKDSYEKFAKTMTVDELKSNLENFNKVVEVKFSGAKTTTTKVAEGKPEGEAQYKSDFETEGEFRNFVADKAVEYMNEHEGVSITEATKLMYVKYSKEAE